MRSMAVAVAVAAGLALLGAACDSDQASGGAAPAVFQDGAGADAAAPDGAADTGPDAAGDDGTLRFGPLGPIAGPAGRGTFAFGVATAATQIEDQNPDTDWWLWTAPKPGGLAKGPFVADASGGFTRAVEDVGLITSMHLDVYRFSMEWARIEPQRDQVSAAALEHYDAVVNALVAAGVRPMLTVHHFSNPVWVDDMTDPDCVGGPRDSNLCGWAHPEGADLIIAELAEHARLLAERYGDRVDDWATINEPVNYVLASHGIGAFPPGRSYLLLDFDTLVTVFRNYLRAHVAVYDAIKAADTVDADGDGVAANVGLTLNAVAFAPTRLNAPSDHPDDVAAAQRTDYVYHYLFPGSLLGGHFDANVDQVPDEEHPDWKGKLDWLGVQYYSRQGVTADPPVVPVLKLMICFQGFDGGSCLPPADPTHFVPTMNYEYWEPGVYQVLTALAERFPDLPLTVTESGIAAEAGRRRAEHVVRSLEQIHRALTDGVDVRGYYHWSLYDNFEWAEGFVPRFGLYRVNFDTFERTPTEGATVLGQIARERMLTPAVRAAYGGLGPMTPETGAEGGGSD